MSETTQNKQDEKTSRTTHLLSQPGESLFLALCHLDLIHSLLPLLPGLAPRDTLGFRCLCLRLRLLQLPPPRLLLPEPLLHSLLLPLTERLCDCLGPWRTRCLGDVHREKKQFKIQTVNSGTSPSEWKNNLKFDEQNRCAHRTHTCIKGLEPFPCTT